MVYVMNDIVQLIGILLLATSRGEVLIVKYVRSRRSRGYDVDIGLLQLQIQCDSEYSGMRSPGVDV